MTAAARALYEDEARKKLCPVDRNHCEASDCPLWCPLIAKSEHYRGYGYCDFPDRAVALARADERSRRLEPGDFERSDPSDGTFQTPGCNWFGIDPRR